MKNILAQSYAFFDFSKIVGFLNPLPNRDEWESSPPKVDLLVFIRGDFSRLV
jgi:hypothetical protein